MARINPYLGRKHVDTGMMRGIRESLTMSIDAPGLDEMIARLQRYAAIGDTDAKRVRAGMSKTVKLVLGQAEKSVPYRTGKLKATLFSKTKTWGEGNVTGNIGSRAESLSYNGRWAGMVPFVLEGGRRANNNGRMIIVPRRWLYGAYKQVKEKIDEIWRGVLEQVAQDLAGKGK